MTDSMINGFGLGLAFAFCVAVIWRIAYLWREDVEREQESKRQGRLKVAKEIRDLTTAVSRLDDRITALEKRAQP